MTAVFWIGAIVLAAMALAFVLIPLLGRTGDGFTREARRIREQLGSLDRSLADGHIQQADYNRRRKALKQELEALLDQPQPASRSTATAVALGVLVPAAAVVTYLAIGEPRALDPGNMQRTARQTAAPPQVNRQQDAPDSQQQPPALDQAIAGLAQRLEQNPNDVEGWMLLGQSYLAVGEHQAAEEALARAHELAPDNPAIMEFYANAMIFASGDRSVPAEAEALLERALSRDPSSQRSLYLLGVAAFQQGDFEQSLTHWEKLVELVDPNSDAGQRIVTDINTARERLGRPPMEAPAADGWPFAEAEPEAESRQPPADGQAGTGQGLTVQVSLSDELKAQVSPSDILFIFARPVDGPKMPLAIQRLPAGRLPITVRLDESMAMTPAMTLSSFPEVVVGARISRSGNATPQPGDLQALSGPVPNNAADPIRLTIDQVL